MNRDKLSGRNHSKSDCTAFQYLEFGNREEISCMALSLGVPPSVVVPQEICSFALYAWYSCSSPPCLDPASALRPSLSWEHRPACLFPFLFLKHFSHKTFITSNYILASVYWWNETHAKVYSNKTTSTTTTTTKTRIKWKNK